MFLFPVMMFLRNIIRQQGHCDYPLTELGKQQADACGVYLKDMKWDKIYSSDLYRAFDTCQLLLKRSEYPDVYNKESIERTTLLRELSFGVREGLPRSTPFDEAVKHVAKTLNIPEEAVEDSTESKEAVYRRQVKFISTLLRDLVLENSDTSIGSDDVLVVDARMKGRSKKAPSKRHKTKEKRSSSGSGSDEGDTDTDSRDPHAPMEVLCLSHGSFIKHFLRNFCGSSLREFPTKIWNCAVSSVTVEWPNPEEPMGFIVTTKQSKVNVNTLEAVAHMKTSALTAEDAAVVNAVTTLVASEHNS